jgi:hypothetical protein
VEQVNAALSMDTGKFLSNFLYYHEANVKVAVFLPITVAPDAKANLAPAWLVDLPLQLHQLAQSLCLLTIPVVAHLAILALIPSAVRNSKSH